MVTIHIIGAGISGLAAATALAERHIPVKLYEASAYAGGRCRVARDKQWGMVDTGLHTIDAGDQEFMRYLKRLDTASTLQSAADIPLPAAPIIDYLPLLAWLLPLKGTAEQIMGRHSILRDAWFTPFAHVRLGTPIDSVPTRAMGRPLLRHLLPRRNARLASASLESFIQPALDYLDYRGASVYFGHPLSRIEMKDGQPTTLIFPRKRVTLEADDLLILATPSSAAQSLLPELDAERTMHSAITVHFQQDHRETVEWQYPLDAPVDVLRYRDNAISTMIRPADEFWAKDDDAIAKLVWKFLKECHYYLDRKKLPPYNVQREKRAGHAVEDRTAVTNDHGRILIAGDWLDPRRPATLETAAASGHAAAKLALERMPKLSARDQQRFYLNSAI